MSDETMNRDDLQRLMADYLGDELPAQEKARIERGLEDHPDMAADVRSLRGALAAMRSLDAAPGMPETQARRQGHRGDSAARRGGRMLRYAAMIGLAFVLGYLVRGFEPQPPAGIGGDGRGSVETQGARINQGDLETRYARQYLADSRRSGLGRSLIAYARTVNERPDDSSRGQ